MKQADGKNLEAPLTRLDDYVRGRLGDAEATDYEEELFGRALEGEADEAVFHASLGATLRLLHARGALELWITGKDAERLRASGKAVFFEWEPALAGPLDIPPEAELLIMRIPLPLADVHQLEVEVHSLDGRLLKRMPDVAFEPAEGAIFACCDADLARTASTSPKTVTKLFAVSESGRRLLIELPS